MEEKQQALLIQAMEIAANSILITDRTGCIVWANDAVCRMSGYSKEQAIGQTPRLFNSGKQYPEFYRILWETILSGQPWQGEIIDRHRNGTLYTVHQVITPLLDSGGNVTHFLCCQHNVGARYHEEKEIRRLAYYDSLTGLPNRKLFLDLLERAIEHARVEHRLIALMFIDLDRFKPVNDVHGHAVGDQLLIAVAERLRSIVRKTDTVARLGGDEFVIVLPNLDDPAVASELAQKLIGKISQTYLLKEKKIEISASIGISLFPKDGESGATLLNCADAAMYSAKAEGQGRYRIFDPVMQDRMIRTGI